MPKLEAPARRSTDRSPSAEESGSESEAELSAREKRNKLFKATLGSISERAGVPLLEIEKSKAEKLRKQGERSSPFKTLATINDVVEVVDAYSEQFTRKCRDKNGVKMGAVFKSSGFNEPLKAYAASDKYLDIKPLKNVSSKRFKWLPEPATKVEVSEPDIQYLEEIGRRITRCLNFSLCTESAMTNGPELPVPALLQLSKTARKATKEAAILAIQLVAAATQIRRDSLLGKAKELKQHMVDQLRQAPFASTDLLFPEELLKQVDEDVRKSKEMDSLTASSKTPAKKSEFARHRPFQGQNR